MAPGSWSVYTQPPSFDPSDLQFLSELQFFASGSRLRPAGATFAQPQNIKTDKCHLSSKFHAHPSRPSPPFPLISLQTGLRLPRRHREGGNPSHHRPEQPPRQMAFRQQQPVVPRVLHQPAAGLHQPLLQTGQRPVVDSLRQHQSPPQVAQVVRHHTQPQSRLVRSEPMATQPGHLHRLLTTARRLPTRCLVQKALVPDHRLITRSSHGPR